MIPVSSLGNGSNRKEGPVKYLNSGVGEIVMSTAVDIYVIID